MTQRIMIASGPVIVHDNKVLLNKSGDTDFWKFCGGRSKGEENLIEIARRRVKEEMGLEINIVKDEPFVMYTKKETPEGDIDVLLAHYLSEAVGEVTPGEEVREWKWLDINNLPSDLAPNIKPTLKYFGFLK